MKSEIHFNYFQIVVPYQSVSITLFSPIPITDLIDLQIFSQIQEAEKYKAFRKHGHCYNFNSIKE